MKQGQIIRAMNAMEGLAAQKLPLEEARRLYKLRASLRPAWDFQVEEEQKLLARLQPTDDGHGGLDFSSQEDAAEFRQRMKELEMMEADDIEYQPIVLSVPDNIVISAIDLEALEGFITIAEA